MFCHWQGSKATKLRKTPTLHPHESTAIQKEERQLELSTSVDCLEFLGERKVHVVRKPIPDVGVGQMLVRTECSAVSTGTELKVFRGDVDPEEAADLTIDGLADQVRASCTTYYIYHTHSKFSAKIVGRLASK